MALNLHTEIPSLKFFSSYFLLSSWFPPSFPHLSFIHSATITRCNAQLDCPPACLAPQLSLTLALLTNARNFLEIQEPWRKWIIRAFPDVARAWDRHRRVRREISYRMNPISTHPGRQKCEKIYSKNTPFCPSYKDICIEIGWYGTLKKLERAWRPLKYLEGKWFFQALPDFAHTRNRHRRVCFDIPYRMNPISTNPECRKREKIHPFGRRERPFVLKLVGMKTLGVPWGAVKNLVESWRTMKKNEFFGLFLTSHAHETNTVGSGVKFSIE